MPIHTLVGSGMIVDTVAVAGVGVYPISGTVTTDGVSLVADAGTLEVVLPGKYLLTLQAQNDAAPASGFTYWLIRLLVNGVTVGITEESNTYVNADQEWSGPGGQVIFPFNKEGFTHCIVDLVAADIINGEIEDPGDTNQNSANIACIITAHYLGPTP